MERSNSLRRFNSLRSLKSRWRRGHHQTTPSSASNASSIESTTSTHSQHEIGRDLYMISFHRKAPKDQVELVKKNIMESGGLVREILILPYQIKATLQGELVKNLMHTKVVKRVDHIVI